MSRRLRCSWLSGANKMRIGILALQGAFVEHARMLKSLHVESFEIRQYADLHEPMDGLIIPGGESTVMGKLLQDFGMMDALRTKIQQGLPVFGTCAGMILLAGTIENEPTVHLGTMDIIVKRNAYGRQLGSFYAEENFADVGKVAMTFIRAPYIVQCGQQAQPLAICDRKIVAARQGRQLVTAFHPELNEDLAVHQYFVERVIPKDCANR